MGTYMGGSAPAMARQVSDGFILLSPVILKRLEIQQMEQLEFELDRRLRDTRAEPMDLEDQEGIQQRNRRLQRIEGSLRVLRHCMQQRRMGRL
ncbi:MAG: hypothetical protein C3F15_07980 [Holophagae bacterium]|nr:MAG: hypothetical protein C3F15_07980 [Holophagae bacterium]